MCEGTQKTMNGSGNFDSELTEINRHVRENKFYGTMKHQDYWEVKQLCIRIIRLKKVF